MIEIQMDFIDWQDNIRRLNEIVYRLETNGWAKFLDCSGILLHKNVIKESANEELKHLGIDEVEPIEWTEIVEV